MNNIVTIAIASYNNAPYIERCIASVLCQTYTDLEILIVDDGSNDDTIERINKYKSDERIKIIEKENGGLSSVRQRGLDEAKGEYICFIDADDYLLQNYVEDLYLKIKETASDLCLISVRFEDDAGMELDNEGYTESDQDKSILLSRDNIADNFMNLRRIFKLSDSWNKMYRVQFLRSTGLKFELPKGFNGSDMAFNHKLILHEPKISSTKYVGYVHLIHSNSAVHRRNRKLLRGYMLIIEQISKECKKLKYPQKFNKPLSILFMELVRRGTKDAVEEGLKRDDIYEDILYTKKILKNNLIKYHILWMPDFKLKIFALLYRISPSLMILLYLFRKL